MPLVGTLSTMPLPDLLQWLGPAGKTGTLRVERDKVCKVIRLRNGSVIGCLSDDPRQRLGHFLLSRHKITEEQLREALTVQEAEGQAVLLGQVLVATGVLPPDELVRELELKAEEIIYSLFDWDRGTFRYEDKVHEEDGIFPVDLRVEDILLRGALRHDEMAQIRAVFTDRLMVLRYTSKPPGLEIFGDPESRSMYSAVDGERSIAEILLHVHGSEYRVQKFLFELYEEDYVEITGIKRSEENRAAPAMEATPDATGLELAPATGNQLAAAGRLMGQGNYEKALEILDGLYREAPGNEALRRLTAEAEAAFVDKAYRHLVPAEKIPVLTKSMESLASESLTPQECFLLSRINGTWNVKSIIQIAPFREADALRMLKRMQEMGMIELHDPD